MWVSGNTQQRVQEKINPKHQTMSEWIIRLPRHRATEWEEGKAGGEQSRTAMVKQKMARRI